MTPQPEESPSTQESILEEELRRLVPLGLTITEAEAWYRNDVVRPLFTKASGTIIASLFALAVFWFVSPLQKMLDSTLSAHMLLAHLTLVGAGFILATGVDCFIIASSKTKMGYHRLHQMLLQVNSAINKFGLTAFLLAALFAAYWNLPWVFAQSAVSAQVHGEMHVTYVLVGMLIFTGLNSLPMNGRWLAPVVFGKSLGLFGIFLLLSRYTVYDLYPFTQQMETGAIMVMTMLAIDLTVVPWWLYNYFGRAKGNREAAYVRQT